MYIADILYFRKEDSEAEVSISDGCYTVTCYAYPCHAVQIGQTVSTLYGFGCTDIIRSDEAGYAVKKLPAYYAYRFVAKVVDNENRIVRIGDLFICLDHWIPKDIMNGEYIDFTVARLDCD